MDKRVDVEALHYFYRGLSSLVGVDNMLVIYQHYRGMQMTMPTHLYDREKAAGRVVAEYDGHNKQSLARKYGYSQKWVSQVLRAAQTKKDSRSEDL